HAEKKVLVASPWHDQVAIVVNLIALAVRLDPELDDASGLLADVATGLFKHLAHATGLRLQREIRPQAGSGRHKNPPLHRSQKNITGRWSEASRSFRLPRSLISEKPPM